MPPQAATSPAVDPEVRRIVTRAVDRLCPSWMSADRDDIIQNTLLRLHQSDAASEGKGGPAASYIWKTAYTVMIDEIRRRGRRPEVALDETDSALAMARPGPSPEQLTAGRELGAAIRECLQGLIPSRRAAVVLHLQGHSLKEVGSLLGWTEKKAENLVYRALAGLRTCLVTKGIRP
jgi:RNA polymerase sigma-70 factor (ECF subfamily)